MDEEMMTGPVEGGVTQAEAVPGSVPQPARDEMPTEIRNRWEFMATAQSDDPSTKVKPVDTSAAGAKDAKPTP